MAEPRRVLRLQQLILETIAQTIQNELDDPRIGMVTVTRVKLSQDLSAAHVFWSSLAEPAVRRTQGRGLEDALPYLQRQVAQALGTRVTPTLSLRFDATMESAQRIDDIFRRIAEERGESPPDAAPAPDGKGPDEPAPGGFGTER
jgi:ribosome-binding factor A